MVRFRLSGFGFQIYLFIKVESWTKETSFMFGLVRIDMNLFGLESI